MVDSLKVGGFTYEVEVVDTHDPRKTADNDGVTLHANLLILIDRELAPDRREETLAHETLHCALNFAGFGEEISCTQEELVTRLSPVLHMIRKDNARPHLPR